jgi:hypothetical protein
MLSAGTQTLARSPVSAPSCKLKTDQAIVASVNKTAVCRSNLKKSSPLIRLLSAANATLVIKANPSDTAYDAAVSRAVCRPAVGMKRTSALIRLSCDTPAIKIIDDTRAALNPTTSGVYSRAASTQYRMPSPLDSPVLTSQA